jgi:hypothetical protein
MRDQHEHLSNVYNWKVEYHSQRPEDEIMERRLLSNQLMHDNEENFHARADN